MYFYTTFCGMSVVQATLIFSIATYLDVILNLVMGFVTDSFYKTKLGWKFGRRRFFILLGIPLMLLYSMLWVKNMNFYYYLCTYVMFEIVYTSVMIPYDTLAVEMTSDSYPGYRHSRSPQYMQLSVYFCSVSAAWLVSVLYSPAA